MELTKPVVFILLHCPHLLVLVLNFGDGKL